MKNGMRDVQPLELLRAAQTSRAEDVNLQQLVPDDIDIETSVLLRIAPV
jgi:hypothetical protein